MRQGQDSDVWPLVLLLFAVAMPAVCLLWFMAAAMRNERFAVRQQLAEVYRAQLSVSQTRLQKHWRQAATELESYAQTESAPAAFARCVRSATVDAVVIFDEQGKVAYPNVSQAVKTDFGDFEARWQEAAQLEHVRKFAEAATRYHEVARAMADANSAARAFQAEARCLAQAGQHTAAIQLIDEVFSSERYRLAADLQGRLIPANAELMILELSTSRNSARFHSTALRLASRLMDYDNPALVAPQRRFLMKALQRLSPEKIEFPTLAAEEMAAELVENRTAQPQLFALQRAPGSDLWQFTTPNRRVLALVSYQKVLAAAKIALSDENPVPGADVTLLPPDADNSDAFLTLAAGEEMPGWRLVLSLRNQKAFDAAAGRQTALYLYTGILVVALMGILTLLALRIVRRRMALARLKNDLAATVSHEFKTPLSSMRVLIETLLDLEKLDEQRTREYLQLIAQENDRLGRLIQNFLTFSRIERNKHAFQFSPVRPEQVIGAAVEAVRPRFESADCQVEVRVDTKLPPVMADAESLAAALANLLENACKYSDTIKQIVVGARAENGNVLFSVQDSGIGIAPRDQKRIFQPFYRADQHLSRRAGGCGLGLSIVQFVTAAHNGSVSVESHPGRGSTFTISLPISHDISLT